MRPSGQLVTSDTIKFLWRLPEPVLPADPMLTAPILPMLRLTSVSAVVIGGPPNLVDTFSQSVQFTGVAGDASIYLARWNAIGRLAISPPPIQVDLYLRRVKYPLDQRGKSGRSLRRS
jgi:hypothetical protein